MKEDGKENDGKRRRKFWNLEESKGQIINGIKTQNIILLNYVGNWVVGLDGFHKKIPNSAPLNSDTQPNKVRDPITHPNWPQIHLDWGGLSGWVGYEHP